MNKKQIGLLTIRIDLSIVTSIFYAIVQVVWGIAGIFLFGSIVAKYGIDISQMSGITQATVWILDNYMLIIYSFFGLKIIENLIQFIKDAKEQEIKNERD